MRLLAQLMRREMISFAVRGGRRGVGVGSQIVQFCDSIMRALWHSILLFRQMRLLQPAQCSASVVSQICELPARTQMRAAHNWAS
jgi:hypothetical protein